MRRVSLAILLAALVGHALARAQPPSDDWLKKPVDDRTFTTYLEFFAYERRLPFETRTIGTEDQQGIRREHLSFQSTPGERVFAHLYHPPGASPKGNAAMILLHGGVPQGKEGPVVAARNLASAGWTVLAIDMKHFGERTTDLFTTFTEQEKHDRLYNQPAAYLAWVAQTVKDVGRAFDFLVSERGADAKRIGLIGNSRGAIVAAIAGGADQRLAAVVIAYGAHFDALERGHLGGACPANYIGRISPRPLLMLNGIYDTDMIKDAAVEPLYALAKQPKQILWSEGGHAAPSEANRAATLRWLRENLK